MLWMTMDTQRPVSSFRFLISSMIAGALEPRRLNGTMTEAAARATCLAVTAGLNPLTETTAPSVRVSRAKRSSRGRLEPKP